MESKKAKVGQKEVKKRHDFFIKVINYLNKRSLLFKAQTENWKIC